jgi:vacuolar-type H+-ATPase catalytic subunit A/Vma1
MEENMGNISEYMGDMSKNVLRLADSNDRSRDDLRKINEYMRNISAELNKLQSTIANLGETNKLSPTQPHLQQPYSRCP